MSDPASPITEVTRELAKYIENNMDKIVSVNDEWPNPNEELETPSMTITSVSPEYVDHPPTVISKKELASGKLKVLYEIGQYNLRMQLDIWADYKDQRGELYEQFDNAFNKAFLEQDKPRGLILNLPNYHNQLVNYTQMGYNFPDSENNSQTGEWRVKIDLIVNFRRVKEVTRNKMDEIKLTSDITDDNNFNGDTEDKTI